MTAQIVAATIHQLDKQPQTNGPNSVKLTAKDGNLPLDNNLTELCGTLIAMYTKQANSNGTLGIDPMAHQFPVHLRNYLSGAAEFLDFTINATKRIALEMSNANFSSGGYSLFLRYSDNSQDFLFVAMLKLKSGQGIDAEKLELTANLNIDLGHLHEAARINLTRWKVNEQPYLTFIKGRARKDGVSDYFRDALACTGYTDSKHHTQQLLRAADDFVAARTDLTADAKATERQDMRRRLFECLESNRDEVPLATLAAAISPSAPEDFISHVKSNADSSNSYNLDDRFKPHRPAFIALKRVTGKIGTVTLAFDVADVKAERVRYDATDDVIILTAPTAELKSAIQENATIS